MCGAWCVMCVNHGVAICMMRLVWGTLLKVCSALYVIRFVMRDAVCVKRTCAAVPASLLLILGEGIQLLHRDMSHLIFELEHISRHHVVVVGLGDLRALALLRRCEQIGQARVHVLVNIEVIELQSEVLVILKALQSCVHQSLNSLLFKSVFYFTVC